MPDFATQPDDARRIASAYLERPLPRNWAVADGVPTHIKFTPKPDGAPRADHWVIAVPRHPKEKETRGGRCLVIAKRTGEVVADLRVGG